MSGGSSSRWGTRGARLAVRLAFVLAPLAIALPHAAGWQRFEALERLENALYDARVRATLPGGVDPRIVIVDIDEPSLAAEGRWPWSRVKLAALLDRLFDDYDVRVVAFDTFFPEPEEGSALALIDELTADPASATSPVTRVLAARRGTYDADARLADSLIARDVVLGFVFQPPRAGGAAPRVGALPAPLTAEKLDVEALPVVEAAGYLGNVAALQANARAGGFFDTALVDADGVVRRMPLLQRFDGALYESLSLATARIAHGAPGVALGVTPGAGGASGLSHIDLGDRSVRVDARGAALIPFRGGVGSFPYVSATDVLNGRTPSELLDGTIVLIGTSAAGLLDIRPTPVAAQYVGVEAHANLIAGLLDGTVRVAPAWARGYEVALLIGWTLLAAFALPRLAPAWAAGLTLASIAGIVAFTLLAWQRAGYVLPLASPLFLVASSATLLLGYGYFVEARRKRRLSRLFGQYVPPEVVTDLDANEAEISLEGESREMSVLFSDVRGFTTLSEGLSPRELTQLMNEMLTPLTAVIQRHRGTIDKYMGDAIMAFWGAPLADPQHARHAVQAALEMVQACAQIRGEFAARGWPEVRIGVGVSSGPMNVGNMGSEFRMAYTVLGDTVNLGSRLEGLTKQYGVEVIVSAATRAAVPEIACRPLDLVRVKGKREPIEIFEPVGERASASSHVLARIESTIAMLAHYRAGRFAAALEVLDALDRDADGPDTLSTLYRERIAWFRAQPPAADWDGVFEHTSK